MKEKHKQIEEMAKDYYGYSIDLEDDCKFVAEEMYNKGHRKLPEDSVVLSKEEYNDLILAKKTFASDGEEVSSDTLLSTFKGIKEQARKETAEKIYRMADEICTGSQNDGDKILAMIKDNFGVEIKE